MTTPARVSEADRVEDAFHWAVSTLGNSAAAEAKQVWEDHMPANASAATKAHRAYTLALLAAMWGYRELAQEVAVSYYRLNRALRTGTTVSVGEEGEGETVSLEKLREDFDALLDEVEELTVGDPVFTTGDPDNDFVSEQPDIEYATDDEDIEVDQVIDITPYIEEADELAESEVREFAENLGTKNYQRKATRTARRSENPEADVVDARGAAGNRQAAAAMRVMMNAARGLAYDLGMVDAKLQGWVRRSTTGTPCGFCAMLIAREDAYHTRDKAQHRGKNQTENKYHDNCKCVTIPIFDMEQFLGSELSDQHKKYAELWKRHIRGKFSGDDALIEWRKLIRNLEGAGSNSNKQSPGEAA